MTASSRLNRPALKFAAVIFTAAVAASVTAGLVVRHPQQFDPIAATRAAPTTANAINNPGTGSQLLPDFTTLVEKNGAAVVNISTVQKMRTPTQGMPMPPGQPGDPFFEFFRRFQGQMPQQQQPVYGVGSGFVVSPDGYILTNAHVVADASEVTVKFTDRRELKAKVIGADKRTDVALIKVDAKDLPAVNIGNPDKLKVGQWVAAIGSPFGLENSVTAGIVSAKSRSLPDDNYVPFIQTDVAINPGNSGGPLFNLNGEVVGINSQIYSRSGGYMGLSFAIPIDVAMNIKDQLQKTGKVSHGKLGVTIQPVTRDLAESFGLAKAEGALISNVEPGGPAEKAGLQSGDVLLAINGKPVDQSSDVPRAIGDMHAGERANLKVWRKGATRDVTVALGEMNQDTVAEAPEAAQQGGKLGLALRPLSPEERGQIKSDGGLVVEEATGPAAQAGIRQGDVLLAFNGEKISSVEQLRKLVGKAKGKVAVLVQRDDARIYVPVNLG
ncbi:MAG TPA: DegQ family serine endoprotease [Burkholderiales bacterium]|nr:DegQ family serine endoprotease [Burkholderiales bacterium]